MKLRGSCTWRWKRGLNFKLTMGNILTLTPALTISYDEMDKALTILDNCFEEISKKKM